MTTSSTPYFLFGAQRRYPYYWHGGAGGRDGEAVIEWADGDGGFFRALQAHFVQVVFQALGFSHVPAENDVGHAGCGIFMHL